MVNEEHKNIETMKAFPPYMVWDKITHSEKTLLNFAINHGLKTGVSPPEELRREYVRNEAFSLGRVKKILTIEDDLFDLIHKSDTKDIHFPFSCFFINNYLKITDRIKLTGIMVISPDEDFNISPSELHFAEILQGSDFNIDRMEKSINKGEIRIRFTDNLGEDCYSTWTMGESCSLLNLPNDIIVTKAEGREIKKTVENIVLSLNSFLNKEKEYVENQVVVSAELNAKRKRRNKPLKRNTNYIKPNEILKKYISCFNENTKKYNGSFLVRGHFRRLKSDKYKKCFNKILWIKPFYKGSGQDKTIRESVLRK